VNSSEIDVRVKETMIYQTITAIPTDSWVQWLAVEPKNMDATTSHKSLSLTGQPIEQSAKLQYCVHDQANSASWLREISRLAALVWVSGWRPTV